MSASGSEAGAAPAHHQGAAPRAAGGALLLDGKAVAARGARRGGRACRGLRGALRPPAGARGGAGGRGSGLQRVRAQQAQLLARGAASNRSRTICRPTPPRRSILALVQALNHDERVDGILVQLPLPKGVDANRVMDAVDPAKDVDGFHPVNTGLLAQKRPRLRPCTPVRRHPPRAGIRHRAHRRCGPRWWARPTSSAGRWRSSCCWRAPR